MSIRVELGYYDATAAIDSSGNHTSQKVPYIVFGAESESAALTAVKGAASATLNGLILNEIEIDEAIDLSTFKIMANYAVPGLGVSSDPEQDPEPVFSFDTGGATTHISTSLATVGKYPAADPTESNDFRQCDDDSDVLANRMPYR